MLFPAKTRRSPVAKRRSWVAEFAAQVQLGKRTLRPVSPSTRTRNRVRYTSRSRAGSSAGNRLRPRAASVATTSMTSRSPRTGVARTDSVPQADSFVPRHPARAHLARAPAVLAARTRRGLVAQLRAGDDRETRSVQAVANATGCGSGDARETRRQRRAAGRPNPPQECAPSHAGLLLLDGPRPSQPRRAPPRGIWDASARCGRSGHRWRCPTVPAPALCHRPAALHLVTSRRYVGSVSFARVALPLTLWSVALAGCRSAGAPGAAEPRLPSTMGGAQTRADGRLANGVRVIVEENHAAPVVAIQVWVSGGAGADPVGLEGTAHFLEYLTVPRHRAAGAGRGRPGIEALGGMLGAWTGPDESVLHAAVAAPYLELGLDVLGDAVTSPRPRSRRDRTSPADHPERNRRGPRRSRAGGRPGFDGGRRSRGEREPAAAGDDGSRGGPHPRAARGPLRPGVRRWGADHRHRRRRRCGGGSGRRWARLLRRAPGAAAGPRPRRPSRRRIAWRGLARFSARPGRSANPLSAELLLGFRSRAPSPEDAAALDVLAALLARGDSGRLNRELVRNGALAERARAFSFCSRSVGLLALGLQAPPAPDGCRGRGGSRSRAGPGPRRGQRG